MFAQIVGNRRQRRGDERQADVARQHLDDQQRQREHEAGERQRRAESGQRNRARLQREGEQRRRRAPRRRAASTPTTPRTGALTGRANGTAARAAAPR